MKRSLLAVPLFALALGLAGTASASSDRCRVPLAEWQPREALQEKLEAEGWQVRRIKTDDGCYEVKGTDDQGRTVEAEFNPQTFEMVKWELDD